MKNDPIYEQLSSLFEGKITESFSNEQLREIYSEGENRYKLKIPPGYEDEKTKEGNKKFGDLILWKQILLKAKELKKDVILINDERKTDWWWKIKDGRNMGPRQELVQEMKEDSGVNFHMYSSERFLSYGQTFLKEQINQKALEEIQAMKKSELEELSKLRLYERRRLMEQERQLNNEERNLLQKIKDIDNKLFELKSNFNFNENNLSEDQKYLYNLNAIETELNDEKLMLIHNLELIRRSIEDKNSVNDLEREINMRNYFINRDSREETYKYPSRRSSND